MQRLTTFSLPQQAILDNQGFWTNAISSVGSGVFYGIELQGVDSSDNSYYWFGPSSVFLKKADPSGTEITSYASNSSSYLSSQDATHLARPHIQTDGKAVIGYRKSSAPGIFVERLNADGTHDASFSTTVYTPASSVGRTQVSSLSGAWSGVTTDGSGTWIAIRNGESGTNDLARSTDDGVTWSYASTGVSTSLKGIAYGNGYFVIATSGSTTLRSTTGAGGSWSASAPTPSSNWTRIGYGNGVFIATKASSGGGASSSNMMRSTDDGATWSSVSTPAFTNSGDTIYYQGISYGNGTWVIPVEEYSFLLDGSEVLRSTNDGVTWTVTGYSSGSGYGIPTFTNGFHYFSKGNGGSNYLRYTRTVDTSSFIDSSTSNSFSGSVFRTFGVIGSYLLGIIAGNNSNNTTASTNNGDNWSGATLGINPYFFTWGATANNVIITVTNGSIARFAITPAYDAILINLQGNASGDKISVSGNFISETSYGPVYSLVMLDGNGDVDTSFMSNMGTGFSSTGTGGLGVFDQYDNFYLACVYSGSGSLDGNPIQPFCKINADGTPDTTYNSNVYSLGYSRTGKNSDTNISRPVIQDDKLALMLFNLSSPRTVRFNTDGTLDSTWNTNVWSYWVDSSDNFLYVRPSDQKMFVSGYNTGSHGYLYVINPDGTEDSTFYSTLGSAFSFAWIACYTFSDGAPVFTGNFGVFNGVTRDGLSKLFPNGGNTAVFAIPAGVTEVTVQPIDNSGNPTQPSSTISVVPNTNYVITINSSTWAFNNPNTLGSIFTWSDGSNLLITWTE